MTERLPSVVVCAACLRRFPLRKVRRLITLWARPGAAGSLSSIKDQHAEDVYRCDECVAEGRGVAPVSLGIASDGQVVPVQDSML